MPRYLVTGVTHSRLDAIGSERHPLVEIDEISDDAARERLGEIYKGEAIYYLRLWKAVPLSERAQSESPVRENNPS
jgi:hypothetical protein